MLDILVINYTYYKRFYNAKNISQGKETVLRERIR